MKVCPASTLRRPLAVTMLAGVALAAAVAAPPAQAAFAPCPTGSGAAPPPRLLGSIGSAIEGMVIDESGRLWVTDLLRGRVLRFDAPGAAPKLITTLPGGSGGGALELEPDGTVIVGSGADPRVFLGDVLKPGAISRIDPVTGKLTQIARGFSAANGLAVTGDGTIYATNDFGGLIGRRTTDGVVTSAWARFPSANGAALSKDDRYLYVSRTFVNAGVSRIPIANPGRPEALLNLQGTDIFAAPDGLTLDSQDRPIVPTNVAGEILRIDAPGKACRLAKNLPSSSVVAYGKGSVGFAKGNLYRAGFDGRVYEIPAAFDAGA